MDDSEDLRSREALSALEQHARQTLKHLASKYVNDKGKLLSPEDAAISSSPQCTVLASRSSSIDGDEVGRQATAKEADRTDADVIGQESGEVAAGKEISGQDNP